jgi:hypothetical protein
MRSWEIQNCENFAANIREANECPSHDPKSDVDSEEEIREYLSTHSVIGEDTSLK